jgi:uncharacterized protein (TIGR02145 family)
MVVKWLFSGLFLLFGVTISYAQKVTNVSNRQEQSTIIVSYDLEIKLPCKIALFVSTNGGTSWQGPLKKVSGDVGENVSSGNKSITWNVLEEFEELRGNNIVFQVRAVNIDIELETVIIGSQEWTKKNLDVSTYRNGDIIPEVTDQTEWAKLTTGAWCHYNNDPENGKIYGKLYNWYAVNDSRGLAPKSYHVPSDVEWEELIKYLGGESVFGGKMKEKGLTHWKRQKTEATNSSDFTGLPAGGRAIYGWFFELGDNSIWWSSSETSSTSSWRCSLSYYSSSAYSNHSSKEHGYSVRCIKD